MRMLSICHALFLLCVSPLTLLAAEGAPMTDGPWDLKSLYAVPSMRWVDETSPIRSLMYGNEPYRGKPTEIFAFYATPGSISGDPSRDKNLPAVVLIHGGGGTAFPEWVELWAKRGYAAIAMDLGNRIPSAPKFDP